MKKYDPKEPCPKCGCECDNKKYSLRFVPAKYSWSGKIKEPACLVWRCKDCEAVFCRAPLDATPVGVSGSFVVEYAAAEGGG